MKVDFQLDKQKSPTTEKGMKVAYGKAKRGGYRFRWYLMLAIVLSPLFMMMYFFAKETVLIIAPGIVSANPVILTAPQESVVKSIAAQHGEDIKPLESLIVLWNEVLANDIETLQQQVINIDETLRNQPEPNFSFYQQAVTETKNNVAEMKQVLERYQTFSKQGQVSQIDMASAFQMYNAAQLSLANAQIALSKARADALQTQIAGPVAKTRRDLLLRLSNLHAKQRELDIESPFTGRVTDVFVQIGERVEQGAPLMMVTPEMEPKIVAYLNPKSIESAQLGSPATIVFPDGKRRKATVSEPTEIASSLPKQLAKPFEGSPALLRVTLSLQAPIEPNQWVEGMPVEVHF